MRSARVFFALGAAAAFPQRAAGATCDAVALPAPLVTTIMASPIDPGAAWILAPDCTLDVVSIAKVDGVAVLGCTDKAIGRIESLPLSVGRLYFDNNPVTEANLTQYTALNHIILAWCGLTNVDKFQFPWSLIELDFDGNNLRGIAPGTIPEGVEILHLVENGIQSLANFYLPSTLTELYLQTNAFVSLDFAIPKGLDTLQLDGNAKLRTIENLTMPDSLATLTCAQCGLQTFRGVQLSSNLQTLDFNGVTLTEFEIRESDEGILKSIRFVGEVAQTSCKDPSATLVQLQSKLSACVISDSAFEAKYAARLTPSTPVPSSRAPTNSLNATTSTPALSPTESPPTDLDTPLPSSSSSSIVAVVVAIVASLVAVAIALFAYRKCCRTSASSSADVGDKYQDAGALDGQGSTANATVGSGPASSFAHHEYLSNDIRNDEKLITYRIAHDEIEILRLIAKGGFGVLHLGMFRGRAVAVKRLLSEKAKDMMAIRSFMDEIRLSASLEHPRIVEFIGVSWSTLQDVAVVIEFMAGGDLHALLRSQQECSRPTDWFSPSDELKAKSLVALDVVDALVYLHSFDHAIIHRDLKAKNVLLSDTGDAKLSDFGISREVLLDETMTGEIGTVAWIAPEVLRGERYSEKADIYSLGVLLVELDTARHPYKRELSEHNTAATPQSNTRIALLVSAGKLVPSVSADCPSDVAALAASCLGFDPQERPSAMDVHYELRKIWQQQVSPAASRDKVPVR